MRLTLLNRFALPSLAVAVAGLMAGCCCHRQPACGPCGASYSPQPAYLGAPSGGCSTGNCGAYPQGAYYSPSAPATAYAPVAYATAAVPMNAMPTY